MSRIDLRPRARAAARAAHREWRRISVAAMVCLVMILGLGTATTGTLGAFTARVTNTKASISTGIFSCSGLFSDPRALAVFDTNAVVGSVALNPATLKDYFRIFNTTTLGKVTIKNTVGPCKGDLGYATFLNSFLGLNNLAGFLSYPRDTRIDNYRLTQDYTLSVWVRTPEERSGGLITFSTSSLTNVTAGTWTSMRDPLLGFNTNGNLVFSVQSAGAFRQITSPLSYTDGRWHHVVTTVSTVNGSTLYVDGVKIASNPDALPQNSQWVDPRLARSMMYIGYTNFNGMGISHYYNGYTGDMSMPMFMSGAASATEVAAWYQQRL